MNIQTGADVTYLVAYIGGLTSFFASCLLPIVPAYLAHLAGVQPSEKTSNFKILKSGILFTIGFISIFLALGAFASVIGSFFAQNKDTFRLIGGILFIFLGLFMLGIIEPFFLYQERKIEITTQRFESLQWLKSILMGLTFGLSWTACVGPILGVILFWASQQDTAVKGMTLLLTYGAGLATPFLVIASFYDKLAKHVHKSQKFGNIIYKVAALIIIVTGILLIANKLDIVAYTLSKNIQHKL